MSGVDISELDDQPSPTDFRRANGAPMVRALGNPAKWDRYSRPSGWGHDLDDESNLVNWRIDRAIDGIVSDAGLRAKAASVLGQTRGRKELREDAIKIGRGEEGSDMGTALHAMSHRLESEEGFRAVEPYASDLAAYLTAIDSAGLVSDYIEVHLCSDEWRAAGTADRIYRATKDLQLPDGSIAPAGTMFIGDLKTGAKLDYSLPGFVIQMAIYCDSAFYNVETDERTPLPGDMHTGYGILVHLPVGEAKCTLMWVDLDVGREGARTVQRVRSWRKRDDFAAPFVFPTSDMEAVLASPMYQLDHPEPDPSPQAPGDDDEWLQAMLPFCQERINVIGQIPEARAMLVRKWPEHIPPFRAAEPTPAHLSEILSLITMVEAAFSIPWPEGDPRSEWNRGKHRSEMDRSYQPPSAKETKQP